MEESVDNLATPAPRRRWGGWRRILLAAGILLLAAVGLFVRDVLSIRHDLNSGQSRLSHLQLTQLDSRASIDASVGAADRELRAGADLTRDSIWLRLLGVVPKIGPQVRAARVLSRSAARVGDIAYQGALKARGQLDAPHAGPAGRLYLIDALRQDLVEVDQQLRGVPTATTGHLAQTLAKAHDKLVTKLAQAKTQLADGLTLTATLRTMLAGPRTYLVLAGNNAEMRSGGITTAAGLIHFQGGDMTTSPFISSFDLLLPNDKGVKPPDDMENLYGFLGPGKEWRTTNTSPNWKAVAQLYADMSAKSPFGKVDGVLFVDVLTLRSVLDVVGPVTVNDARYTAKTVVGQLLYTNYLLYPTGDQTNARRDVQSNVARAAFAALRGSGYSLPKLAHELQLDAKGRHLLAWSADSAEEAMWTKLGADGAIGPDDFQVSVQNVSGSKLDLFIDPVIGLSSATYSDHKEVNLYVTVTNPRRGKTSAYIEGGFPCCVLPGDQRFYLLFYLPKSAYHIVSYQPKFSTSGSDGDMTVVGMIDTVPYAQTTTVHISFYLPTSQRTVTLVPSSRVKPEQYVVNGVHADDAVPAKLPV
ncbi:MAG TPA: DUF4012 domain-containing protein [Acidimicrobiales bacterium]|nr:DUF4012 domain-containing protein [Acidimicrobiales bacterium]